MADPLSVLRDYCVGGKLGQVKLAEDGRIYFADQYSFPTTSYTAFKSGVPGGDFYDLGTVHYFITMLAASDVGGTLGAYISGCKQQQIKAVAVVDRKPLRQYLLGQVDASALPNLAEAAPAPIPSEAEPAAKKPRLEEGPGDILRVIRRQERQLRDRNSMLLAPGGKDFKHVLELVDQAKRLDELAAKTAKQAAATAVAVQKARAAPGAARAAGKPAPQAPAFYKPSGRLERDTRAETARALGQAEELGLGYGAPAVPGAQQQRPGAPGGAPAPPAPPPPGAAAPAARQDQRQRRPGGGEAAARERGGSGGAARQAGASAVGQQAGGKKRHGVPIILVPAGMSALVNMYNAKQLLEGSHFVRSQDAMSADPVKPASLTVQRTAFRDKPVTYCITDKAPPKGSSDWKRVVAVIVQGKAWQFKDFPFKGADKGELVETFQKVLGLYVHFADEKPPDTVRSWNVRYVPLQRDSRHLDKVALLDAWKALDAFLAARRSELDY